MRLRGLQRAQVPPGSPAPRLEHRQEGGGSLGQQGVQVRGRPRMGLPCLGGCRAGGQGRERAGAQGLARQSPDCPGACIPREISAEAEREPQQLQNYWSEVRYTVRCIYRQAGTPLADDQDQSLVPDKEGVKELVDRYALPGPGPSWSPRVLSRPLSGSASGTWWQQTGRVKAPVLILLDACCLRAEGEQTCSRPPRH